MDKQFISHFSFLLLHLPIVSVQKHQHYWNREQQFPVEEKPIITPRQTETTSSAQSSYENTYTNSLRSYTSDPAGYSTTGEFFRQISKNNC